MIHNPILPGFHADPCICRKGDDFYVAVSSFEWFPGIPIYHSKDMKNWELYSHALTNADDSDLKKLPSAKGIWAPHLTKHGDYYYIMCAEGDTGYYHSVTMGRSKNVYGPYEADPCNPILTSAPGNYNERADWDHLKPRYYNPESKLQKSGHASYVDLPNGETWMVHLTSRPFVPEFRCTLGRETAIQRMKQK